MTTKHEDLDGQNVLRIGLARHLSSPQR